MVSEGNISWGLTAQALWSYSSQLCLSQSCLVSSASPITLSRLSSLCCFFCCVFTWSCHLPWSSFAPLPQAIDWMNELLQEWMNLLLVNHFSEPPFSPLVFAIFLIPGLNIQHPMNRPSCWSFRSKPLVSPPLTCSYPCPHSADCSVCQFAQIPSGNIFSASFGCLRKYQFTWVSLLPVVRGVLSLSVFLSMLLCFLHNTPHDW